MVEDEASRGESIGRFFEHFSEARDGTTKEKAPNP
jgi:hypothetical protein